MQRTNSQYLPQIDVLRAAAVLAVVGYHAAPDYLPGGFIGVDVFFVISGFVIARGYQARVFDGTISPLEFLQRRIKRLFPAAALLLLTCSIFAVFVLEPVQLMEFGYSVFASAVYLQNVYFWSVGDYFSRPLDKPLLHMWSLAVEEQFYLFWPLALILLRRFRWFLLVLLVIFAVSIVGSGLLEVRSPKTVFYWLPFRIWQFGLGIIAFNLTRHATGRWAIPQSASLSAALALVVVSTVAGGAWADFPSPGNTLTCLAVAYALFTFDVSKKSAAAAFTNEPTLWVGRLSYSWYLWHWPPLSFFYLMIGRPASVVEGLVMALLSLAAAWASYTFVENPIRKSGFSKAAALRLWKYGSLALLGFGVLAHVTSGLVDRYPAQVRALYLAQLQGDRSRCDYLSVLTDPEREFCTLSQAGGERPTILFLGDSHTAVLQETLREVGDDLDMTMLMTTRNCDLGRYGTIPFCSDRVFAEVQEQAERESVDAVFAISLWDTSKFSADDMSQELDELARLDIPVLVMETVPNGAAFDPGVKLEHYDRTGELDLSGMTLTQSQEHDAAMAQVLADAVSQTQANARVLRPRDYLCSAGECPFIVDGEPQYFDDSHLTRAGAQRLRPMFEDALRSLDAAQGPSSNDR